jgi:uncharacterized protein YjfI (DUF2170 family)
MKILTEAGLLHGDLNDLIVPMVDIDTFESKISNSKAVVVAFYLFEQDPARDLERFIEKGAVDVLDAETSPAPTDDGYYVVFVELSRDDNLPEHLMEIISSVDNLTDIDQWQFKTLHDKNIYDLTEENLRDHVNLDPKKVPPSTDEDEDAIKDETRDIEPEERPDEEEELAERLVPMLQYGLMESIEIVDDQVILRSGSDQLVYRVMEITGSEPSIPVIAARIGDPLIRESMRLSRMLGSTYLVETADDALLVETSGGYILLKPLD